jgi:hypothetical protein
MYSAGIIMFYWGIKPLWVGILYFLTIKSITNVMVFKWLKTFKN